MWDTLFRHPRGRISLRNLPLLATGLFVAVFLCIGLSHTAYAEDVARTSDGAFAYQGKVFNSPRTLQQGDALLSVLSQSNPDSLIGTTVYQYQVPNANRIEMLLFAPGIDPTTASSALYTTFTFTAPSTYSNQSPSPPQSLVISSNPAVVSSQNVGANSCGVPGVGWIVCPVTGLIAGAVDQMYKILMIFLDVQPLMANSPIYDVWNAIRGLANILFVIAFLIIIFSQVTSLGISTYGIRKMLPRLVIAAILVNISYYICALAVDLSNYLGHSVYMFMKSYTDSLASIGAVEVSWDDIGRNVLAMGTGAGALIAGHLWFSAATAGGPLALLFTFLGMVITVAVAVFTALVILAARQALLIVFTIISPLAFVAMTLPSTEKWYKKWQSAILALLFMFPIFSFLFGAALLAGAAIIVGANGNIFLIILGKAVQILPLAITPLIVKFSTGILGTIAQFTNNKNKGVIDRAKNWTHDQAEHHRKKSLANQQRWYNPWRSTAQYFDTTKRTQARLQEGYEDEMQRRAKSTVRYRSADTYARTMSGDKELANARLDDAWYRHMRSAQGQVALKTFIDTQTMSGNAAAGKTHIDNIYNDLRKGEATEETTRRYGDAAATAMARRAYTAAERQNAANLHKNNTDQEVIKKLNEELLSNGAYELADGTKVHRTVYGKQLQEYATGIGNAKRMLAIEIEKNRKIEEQEANAAFELMKEFNIVDANDFVKLATNSGTGASQGVAVGRDSRGNEMTFKFSDMDSRAAAIQWVAKNGAYGQKKSLAMTAADPNTNAQLAGFIQRELTSNGFGKMAPWANDKAISEMGAGKIGSMNEILFHDFREIQEGRIKGDGLMSANAGALEELFSTYRDRLNKGPQWESYLDQQEAMIRREQADSGKTDAEIDAVVANFRSTIDDRYMAQYYDVIKKAQDILGDDQLRANVSTQSITKMEEAVDKFYETDEGRAHVEYRQEIEAAKAAKQAGTATPEQIDMLNEFFKLNK